MKSSLATVLTMMVFSLGLAGGCSSEGSADPSDDVVACMRDEDCFEVEGNTGAAIGLCQSLEGTRIDGCAGARTGCCKMGGQTTCYFEAEDPNALQNLCMSQSGTWTPG